MSRKTVEALETRMNAIGFSNLQSKVWPGHRHESLDELNCDEITADFVQAAA